VFVVQFSAANWLLVFRDHCIRAALMWLDQRPEAGVEVDESHSPVLPAGARRHGTVIRTTSRANGDTTRPGVGLIGSGEINGRG